MMIRYLFFLITFVLYNATASAQCPPFQGSFFVNQQDLYPESADWDPIGCRLYISSQFNCSLAIYDPYNRTIEIVDLPGISHPGNASGTEYHLTGIDYDAKSRSIFITASDALAFTSVVAESANGQIAVNYSAANYTGPNRVLIYNTINQSIDADISLAEAQEKYFNVTGNYTSGFQDQAEVEATGDSYVIGTFGNSIARIPYQSKQAQLWYSPPDYNITYGFGGIVSISSRLIISDSISTGLVTFDTTQQAPVATNVPLQGLPAGYLPNADGLYSPSKYNNTVLLWSDDFNGTSVLGSNDTWNTAHFLGLIQNDDPAILEGAMTTDSFEIGDSVYAVAQIFEYSYPVQRKKNFVFYDITAQLDGIVQSSFIYGNSKLV